MGKKADEHLAATRKVNTMEANGKAGTRAHKQAVKDFSDARNAAIADDMHKRVGQPPDDELDRSRYRMS